MLEGPVTGLGIWLHDKEARIGSRDRLEVGCCQNVGAILWAPQLIFMGKGDQT